MKLALRSNVGGAIAMMIARILLAFATCVLAASAQAATFFASPQGAGTACSSGSPCSLSQLISKVQAGDIGIVNAGTYTGNINIIAKSGTAAEPITLRAQNFAVTCTDPVNDPDGCQVANTASRSFLNLILRLRGSDFWNLEGFQIRDLRCGNASVANSSNNGRISFVHFISSSNNKPLTFDLCSDWIVEHSYFTGLNSAANTGDYGIISFWTEDMIYRNLYFGGQFNHSISLKRGDRDITIDRIVCEGAYTHCMIYGQEQDDTQHASASSTSCPSRLVDDGTVQNITDQTVLNVRASNIFVRRVTNSGWSTRAALYIDNVRGSTTTNVFAHVGNHRSAVALWHRNFGHATYPGGRCGAERGLNVVRGMVVDASASASGCALISSAGEAPATLTLENWVCHGADDTSDPGITFATGPVPNNGIWETIQPPEIYHWQHRLQ